MLLPAASEALWNSATMGQLCMHLPSDTMLEDYFSLQLAVAAHYSVAAGVPWDAAITRCTNLRRRFHLWGPEGAEQWSDFLAQARCAAGDHAAVLAICSERYATRPRIEMQRSFGCFSYEVPDASGVLRMHFMPPDGLRASPLAAENIGDRLDELRALFSHVRRTEQRAASVRGVSWLYRLDAYRRLFPASYVASIRPASFPLHLNGSSTWGQVLNWRQEVKPAMRDVLLTRLSSMNVDAPWEIFPHQALVATGEVGAFYELLL